MIDALLDLASNALNIAFAGSLWFGIFWLLVFSWLVPKDKWFYLWLMFLFLTFLAYGHEAMKKHLPKQQSAAERYEQVKDCK